MGTEGISLHITECREANNTLEQTQDKLTNKWKTSQCYTLILEKTLESRLGTRADLYPHATEYHRVRFEQIIHHLLHAILKQAGSLYRHVRAKRQSLNERE